MKFCSRASVKGRRGLHGFRVRTLHCILRLAEWFLGAFYSTFATGRRGAKMLRESYCSNGRESIKRWAGLDSKVCRQTAERGGEFCPKFESKNLLARITAKASQPMFHK